MPKGILLLSSDDYSNLVYSTLSRTWGLAFQDVPVTDINETVDQIVALETQLVKVSRRRLAQEVVKVKCELVAVSDG